MATLIDFSDSFNLGHLYPHVVPALSAIYSGPIGQEVFDLMQGDMDKIADGTQGELFVQPSNDVTRCMEWRMNYFLDMQTLSGEFERFQETFSFKKPYTSEDPLESFKDIPSAAAFYAFMMFQ